MRTRASRWLVGAALALAVAYGLLFGEAQPTTVYGADPTPTSAQSSGSDPGGHGGGH